MPKITELFAYVMADADSDDEGIPAALSDSVWYPLMGADRGRMEKVQHLAQTLADAQGKTIKLVRSTGLEVVETVKPRTS